jgi:hypothetical protein
MRFIIMHKTEPSYEAGEAPSPELVARVGKFIGELVAENKFGGGDGLRASSLGLRLRFSGGQRTAIPGPFTGENELPAGFVSVRTRTLEEAAGWADRLAGALGEVVIDIRPMTEAWDIGIAPRPPRLETTRYMLLYKTNDAPVPAEKLRPLTGEMSKAGVLLAAERLAPSRTGRRMRFRAGKRQVIDGPFTESKELIAGYSVVLVDSLDEATHLAELYGAAVACEELDVRLVD